MTAFPLTTTRTPATKTRSQQRLEQLINAGRPLTQAESDELYRALHADYMRKWRQRRAAQMGREARRFAIAQERKRETHTLAKVQRELARGMQ